MTDAVTYHDSKTLGANVEGENFQSVYDKHRRVRKVVE
jgi:hypothetical protein